MRQKKLCLILRGLKRQGSRAMETGEIAYLVLVLAALAVFVVALGLRSRR